MAKRLLRGMFVLGAVLGAGCASSGFAYVLASAMVPVAAIPFDR